MRFPSIKAVAASLREINAMEAGDTDCADENYIDVRLCIEEDGSWIVRWGDSSYDQRHSPICTTSSVPGDNRRFNSTELARELLSEARDQHAEQESYKTPLATEITREQLTRYALIDFEAMPDETPVEGNALASGDDATDQACYAEINARLESGDQYAWFVAKVRAQYEGMFGTACLGGCSYASRADFMAEGGTYRELCSEALDELFAVIVEKYQQKEPLIHPQTAVDSTDSAVIAVADAAQSNLPITPDMLVGLPATICHPNDRYPAEIVEVSPSLHTITVKHTGYRADDSFVFRRDKLGVYRAKGGSPRLHIGHAETYRCREI